MNRTLRSKKLRAALYYAYDGKCAICGCELGEDWEADHVVPWSISKRTNVHEMQPLCPKCNRAKGKKMLRKHQAQLDQLSKDIASGVIQAKRILAYVTPGGGKSDLPAILCKNIAERLNYRICWVVPRDALRKQGELSFSDHDTIDRIGHVGELRAADNKTPLVRSGAYGYITTYQAIAKNPQIHRDEFELAKHRGIKYILFLDECHHVPAPNENVEDPEEKAYYKTIAPLVDLADVTVFATGTLERHDKAKIAFLPYMGVAGGEWVDTQSKDISLIRYTRKDGLEEGAIMPLHMAYGDGAAVWTSADGEEISVNSIAEMDKRSQSAALRTVLETDYAYALIDKCLDHWKRYKQQYKAAKLLIIAPSQRIARQYNDYIIQLGLRSDCALSDDGDDAKKAIDRFKGKANPHIDILVSVAIAYEGLDVKQISHVALLTKYRSKPWIEQAISRANRAAAGKTHGYIYAPDDPSLRKILDEIEKEQQGVVFVPIAAPKVTSPDESKTQRAEISPLGSEFTRSRGYGLDDGTQTTYEEDAILQSAMAESGLIGSTVQMKQALISLGMADLVHVNGAINNNRPVLIPISERENRQRANITKYINSVGKGDADVIRTIRMAAKIRFGEIGTLGYDKLCEQWSWLQSVYPGGVVYDTEN